MRRFMWFSGEKRREKKTMREFQKEGGGRQVGSWVSKGGASH